jgi:uncharacterized protein YciI
MPWYVKIERGVVDKPTFDQFVPAHKAYVQALNAAGHQATTGYWKQSRGGMLLFHAADLAQAQHIVSRDPLVMNGCVEYDLHEWVQINLEPSESQALESPSAQVSLHQGT